MNHSSGKAPEFFSSDKTADTTNSLLQYVQAMAPDTIAQLSNPVSADVFHVMEHNIVGLLGGLPSQGFDVQVTTSREHLGRLLASAMMSGYFLRGAEQRMAIERSLLATESAPDAE